MKLLGIDSVDFDVTSATHHVFCIYQILEKRKFIQWTVHQLLAGKHLYSAYSYSLEFAIREGLKLNGTCQFVVCADDDNSLCENINTK